MTIGKPFFKKQKSKNFIITLINKKKYNNKGIITVINYNCTVKNTIFQNIYIFIILHHKFKYENVLSSSLSNIETASLLCFQE